MLTTWSQNGISAREEISAFFESLSANKCFREASVSTMARSKQATKKPRRLQEAEIEEADRHPVISGRNWGETHTYQSPEQLLTEAADGVESWAADSRGGRSVGLTRALSHAKWRSLAGEIEGDSKLSEVLVKPTEWLLTLQMYEGAHLKGVRLQSSKVVRHEWLVAKKIPFSGGKELGLFAAKHFKPGTIIITYAGVPAKKASKKGVNDKRKVMLVGGNSVDVPLTPIENRVISFGGHCCNSPYWDMHVDARSVYEQNHRMKKHNARFEGFQIVLRSEIRNGEEILIDCNPGDQTEATKKSLEEITLG